MTSHGTTARYATGDTESEAINCSVQFYTVTVLRPLADSELSTLAVWVRWLSALCPCNLWRQELGESSSLLNSWQRETRNNCKTKIYFPKPEWYWASLDFAYEISRFHCEAINCFRTTLSIKILHGGWFHSEYVLLYYQLQIFHGLQAGPLRYLVAGPACEDQSYATMRNVSSLLRHQDQ